ncbi:hypothetical protein [Rhodopirellula sp. MGV]|uniref:hypothetical protein n=1 Tax=Rhodopirellula sp. MGV TaxID=2023130 RepID=UPI000BD23418|nr:hypothetical protein [Rhodopirellula sp. MGV]OYP34099.1 hypothetical protein CGZ80_16365 [Rhodopirellula sp. MGV]
MGLIAIPLAVGGGHGSLPVAVYGARILLLHFPVLFLFASVFNREDVWLFAKAFLLIAIPMTLLLGLQFYLPQTHLVNVGVGGDGTSVFAGAAGRHRSSGTFSFTNGLSSFYAIAGALFAGWITCGPRPIPKWVWITGGCLIVALPLTISRALAFQYALTVVFTVMAVGISPKLLKSLVPALIGFLIVGAIVSQTEVFQTAMEPFTKRWENATESEGGDDGVAGVLQNRVLQYGLLSAFESSDQIPWQGLGIGMGTNVGAKMLTGKRTFLIAEGGWGAMLGELGPILGGFLILYRVCFTTILFAMSVVAVRRGNPLPLILGSVAIHTMFMGNTAQPTALGFIVLNSGMLLAALRMPRRKANSAKLQAA